MIVLASASPRRRELLTKMGIRSFTVLPARTEEPFDPSLPPGQALQHIALGKARDTASRVPAGDIVVAADTLVFLDGVPLGKPRDIRDAERMLRALSGREHLVVTGMAVLRGGEWRCDHAVTRVRFLPLTEEMIRWYLSTGEPMDKAGAYGVQGMGGLLVDTIDGDYYNVVGLPIAKLAPMLLWAGCDVFDGRGGEA